MIMGKNIYEYQHENGKRNHQNEIINFLAVYSANFLYYRRVKRVYYI